MLFPVSSISRIETELEFHQDDVLLVGYPKTGQYSVVWSQLSGLPYTTSSGIKSLSLYIYETQLSAIWTPQNRRTN